jgi:hypothetical protein
MEIETPELMSDGVYWARLLDSQNNSVFMRPLILQK